jgi:hypothetical protein
MIVLSNIPSLIVTSHRYSIPQARRQPRGTEGSNPASSSGESSELRIPLAGPDFFGHGEQQAVRNWRPIAAPICATRRTDAKRSKRAISEACKLVGIAKDGNAISCRMLRRYRRLRRKRRFPRLPISRKIRLFSLTRLAPFDTRRSAHLYNPGNSYLKRKRSVTSVASFPVRRSNPRNPSRRPSSTNGLRKP